MTVLAQNCGGEAAASFAVQVMTEITTPSTRRDHHIIYTDPQW